MKKTTAIIAAMFAAVWLLAAAGQYDVLEAMTFDPVQHGEVGK